VVAIWIVSSERHVDVSELALRLAPQVQDSIRSMHPDLKRRIRAALEGARIGTQRGKRLVGDLSGWSSLHVGRLRIIYRPAGKLLEVAAIGPRSSIYLEAVAIVRRGGES
jgi:mRNA interferase RelE/StbE